MIYIMMATYNGERYIREQIDSILLQNYSEWRLWINDDGSTDGTLTILQEYKEKYPLKIELLQSKHKNRGAKGNFAYIYKNVPPAEYYAFCDQDDVWDKDKIHKLLNRISQEDQKFPTLVYHDVQVVDKDKMVISPSFFKYTGLNINHERRLQQLLLYNCVPGCTMMFNHALKEKVVRIPETCVMHDWWLLLSAYCLEASVIKVDASLAQYRQHGNNDMGVVKRKNIGQTVAKCLDIISFKKYLNNNSKMKRERILHAELLLENYKGNMPETSLIIVRDCLKLLNGTNRWKSFKEAEKKGFVFYNIVYTMKFYLLN